MTAPRSRGSRKSSTLKMSSSLLQAGATAVDMSNAKHASPREVTEVTLLGQHVRAGQAHRPVAPGMPSSRERARSVPQEQFGVVATGPLQRSLAAWQCELALDTPPAWQ